jgi:hypothetical protein
MEFWRGTTLAKPSSFHLILPVSGGLAEDGEIESRTLWSGIGEDELVCQRGLPASRGARDNVEREFGEAARPRFRRGPELQWGVC